MENLEQIVSDMIGVRDLCGNEREALHELGYEYLNRPFTQAEREKIMLAVNKEWRYWQAKAGVASKYHRYGSNIETYNDKSFD